MLRLLLKVVPGYFYLSRLRTGLKNGEKNFISFKDSKKDLEEHFQRLFSNVVYIYVLKFYYFR